MKITSIIAKKYDLKLKEPFTIALGTITKAQNILVEIELDNGLKGYGEGAPVAFITGENQNIALSAVNDVLGPLIVGQDPRNIALIHQMMERIIVGNNSAKAAIDIALYDLMGQIYNVPVYQLLGGFSNQYETDNTIGIASAENMGLNAAKIKEMGFSIVKVKVGQNYKEDITRIAKVREALGSDIKIRVDANQGWTVKEAIFAINATAEYDLELVEQPVKYYDLAGMAEIRKRVNVPIMADESVFTPQDAYRALELGACDLINIKLMKCGGLFKGSQIAAIANSKGVGCIVGCMLESRLANTAGAHLVCGTANIFSADLDSPFSLQDDPVQGGVKIKPGIITLSNQPGLGIKGVE